MEWFLQQLINGLALGAIYALIALGYTMVYGVLRFINFAHSDVLMPGAFPAYFLAPAVRRVFPAASPPGPRAVLAAGRTRWPAAAVASPRGGSTAGPAPPWTFVPLPAVTVAERLGSVTVPGAVAEPPCPSLMV